MLWRDLVLIGTCINAQPLERQIALRVGVERLLAHRTSWKRKSRHSIEGAEAACHLEPLRSKLPRFNFKETDVASGIVKWFNPTKGYGFIQPDRGGKDVFVHISAVEKAGLSDLREGAKISYEEIANKGKTSAENLKLA